MNLTFKQRVAIKYFNAKFKALLLVNEQLAAKSAFKLFCIPYSGKPKRVVPPLFKKATTFSLLFENNTISGWKFLPHQNAKTVLVAHGFDSCCYKFETIINGFLQRGINVICFDAPAHGTSDGKTINSLQYANCMQLVYKEVYTFDAVLSHSLAGLATALFIEKTGLAIPLILIAPSTNTYTAIDNFFTFLHVPQQLKPHFHTIIKELSGQSTDYFNVARVATNIKNPILWVHDEEDAICPINDIKPLMQTKPAHIQFSITKGLGHNKIYRDKKVQQQFLNWLSTQLG